MKHTAKQLLPMLLTLFLLIPIVTRGATFQNPLSGGTVPEDIIGGIIKRIIEIMLAIAGSAALAGIIYGGLRIILGAMSSESEIAQAKKIITWCVIGLLVIGLAGVIISAVGFVAK